MKKMISFLLVLVMILSLCACYENSNEIKLTMDNYSDYLKVSVSAPLSHDIKLVSGNNYRMFLLKDTNRYIYARDASSSFYVKIDVEGVSPNFQYSDVTFEIRVAGRYYSCPVNLVLTPGTDIEKHSIDQKTTIECDLNISGEGEMRADFPIPNKNAVPTNIIWEDDALETWDVTVEILSITGSITPA